MRKINGKPVRKMICSTSDLKTGQKEFSKITRSRTLFNIVRNEVALSTTPGEIKGGRGDKILPLGSVNTQLWQEMQELRVRRYFSRGLQIGFCLGDADIFRGLRDNREGLGNPLIGRPGKGRLPERLALSHFF